MKYNSTFRRSKPIWANACVGNNGTPTFINYAKGFSSAANLLIDEVLKYRDLKHSVDDFIYPICFNMRHSVELRLKGTVEQLKALHKFKGIKLDFDSAGSHHIGKIWDFVKLNSTQFDCRYSYFIDKLESYIQDIAEVDATGQTFRYPYDTEGEKHLIKESLINIFVLKQRFNELEKIFEKLNWFNDFLEDEYSLKTFTKHLSRADLFHIADELPDRSTWATIDFYSIKQRLMQKYAISSREFSKAVNFIKNKAHVPF